MRPFALPVDRVPAAPVGTDRLVWADAAKGLSIALVVLHHLTTKHYDLLLPDGSALAAFWHAVTEGLRPVRMPLFFLISGMFAAGAARRPWGVVARKRVASPYYLYAVWLAIHAAFFSVLVVLPMNRTRSVSELVADLLVASTGLWYLYALAVYFVLAKALLRLDSRLVLLAAAAASGVSSLLPIEAANRESLVQHFVFFLVGVLAPDLPRRVAEHTGRHTTGILATTAAMLTLAAVALGLPESSTTLLVGVAAVPLAIRLVVAACSARWFASVIGALGRHTLPVYVLHVPLLSLLHHVAVQLLAALDLTDLNGSMVGAVALAGYPAAATAVLVAGCLALRSLLVRGGLTLLFQLPSR